MNNENTNGKIMARIRVQKYRTIHRRIDYVPSPLVLAVIEMHWDAGLDSCLAGTIDMLILAGDKAISGNVQG